MTLVDENAWTTEKTFPPSLPSFGATNNIGKDGRML